MNEPENIFQLEENEYGNKINCVDFSTVNGKLVYGCSNGLVKVNNFFETLGQNFIFIFLFLKGL